MKSKPEFKSIKWDDSFKTEIKTLDSMIEKYGNPELIKIDTEGNERDILSSLSYPAPVISFEFLPGDKTRAIECLERISEIGNYEFNFSVGESMKMKLKSMIPAGDMQNFIESYPVKGRSGDIYAILKNTT